jgi:hypothetical protein
MVAQRKATIRCGTDCWGVQQYLPSENEQVVTAELNDRFEALADGHADGARPYPIGSAYWIRLITTFSMLSPTVMDLELAV